MREQIHKELDALGLHVNQEKRLHLMEVAEHALRTRELKEMEQDVAQMYVKILKGILSHNSVSADRVQRARLHLIKELVKR